METKPRPILKRREQVLVVEDDVESCELLGTVLHEAGYSIDLAHDGEEALELASRRRPDIVVSDLQMPGMSGIDLTREMHSADPHLPVVLTTGVENTQDVLTAAEGYGAVACLKKPIDLDQLLWLVEKALAVSRQRGRRPGPPLVAPTR